MEKEQIVVHFSRERDQFGGILVAHIADPCSIFFPIPFLLFINLLCNEARLD